MKVIKTAAMVVGAVALVASIAVTGGASLGVSAGLLSAIGAGAGLVGTLANAVSPPKAAKGTIGGAQTEFKLDPNAGIPYLIGRTYAGGNIVHRETWGTDNQYQGFAVTYSGAGPVQGLETFLVDYTPTGFDGAGNAQGTNAGWLYARFQNGDCPSGAIGSPVAGFPGVSDASFKLSGYAAATLVFKFDVKSGKKWSTGIPKTGGVWNGVKVYDPRQDSTYPGGNGACRALNEATYVGGAAAKNPWLHALTFALGRYQNGRRVLGIGQKVASIDVASFVDAANVADANAWTVGGIVYSIDDKWDVMRQLAQAGGGQCIRLGARLSCYVNAPKVALATVNEADLVGKGSVTPVQTYRDRLNGMIPKFRSEADGWEMVPSSVVRVAAYVAADGGEKTQEWPLPLVQDRTQAGQLTAYELVNRRELGPIMLPLFIRFLGYKPGDALNLKVASLGLNNQLAVVRRRQLNPETGDVQLQLVSEDSTKHAFALGQSPNAPPAPSLTVPDEAIVAAPPAGSWIAAGGGLQNGKAVNPVVVVYGNVTNPIAESFLVEYKLAGTAEWLSGGTYPAKTTRVQITSVAPGSSYDTAVTYIRRGVIGERLVLAAVQTSSSVAGSSSDLGQVGKLDEIYFGSPTLKESSGGVAATLGNFKTQLGTSAAIAGQADWATYTGIPTANMAGRVQYLSTGGLLDSLLRVGDRKITLLVRADGSTIVTEGAVVTGLGTAAAIAGQADWATYGGITTGNMAGRVQYLSAGGALDSLSRIVDRRVTILYRDDGSTVVTESAIVTTLGTAAAIAGQSQWATYAGLAPSAVANPAANLIYNGSFRLGLEGWTGPSSFSWQQGTGEGAYVLNQSSGTLVLQSQSYPIAAGAPLALQAEVFAAGVSQGRAYARLVFLDGSNAVVGYSPNALGVNGLQWTPATAQAVVPNGTATFAVQLVLDGATNTQAAWRRVKVSQTTFISPFSDERTTGALYGDGQSIRQLQPQEASSNRTETRTASAIAGQADWATYTGIPTANMAGRVQYLSTGGAMDSLVRITDRRITQVFRADGSTAVTESAVVTSLGTAQAIVGQSQWATTTTTVTFVTGSYPNILYNGGLRLGTVNAQAEGWDSGNSSFLFKSDVNGNYYELSTANPTGYGLASTTRFLVQNGLSFTVQFEYMGIQTTNLYVYAQLTYFNAAGNDISISSRIFAVSGGQESNLPWRLVSGTIAVNDANAVSARLLIGVEGGQGGTVMRVRRLKVSRGTEANLFSDEATNGARILDSRSLTVAAAYGIRSLNQPPAFSSSINGSTATVTIDSTGQYVSDFGTTLTLPSASFPGLALNTLYYFYRNMTVESIAGSYAATTNVVQALGANKAYFGRYTTPNSGGGGGSGGGYGDQNCVSADAWVPTANRGVVRARDVVAGDMLYALLEDMTRVGTVECQGNKLGQNVACTLLGRGQLSLAINTPLTLPDGSWIVAANAWGRQVAYMDDPTSTRATWETLPDVRGIEDSIEVAEISCHNATFAAGDDPTGPFVFSHNIYYKP